MWVVLALFCALAIRHRELPNHYQVIGVPVGTPKYIIQQQYRSLAKQFHPDRLATGDLSENQKEQFSLIFAKLQLSYETLINDARRATYEKFGDFNEKGELLEGTESGISMVTLALAFQILCFVLGYFATMPKQFHQARMLFVLFNVGVFCIELHLRFLDSAQQSFHFWPFNGLVAFEKIELFKRLFPITVALCMIISDFLFSDESSAMLQLLHAVVLTNRLVCQRVTELLGQQSSDIGSQQSVRESLNGPSIAATRKFAKITKEAQLDGCSSENSVPSQQEPPVMRLANSQPVHSLGLSINSIIILALVFGSSYYLRSRQ